LTNNDLIEVTTDIHETLKKIKFEDISFIKCYSKLSTIHVVTKDSISKIIHRDKAINEVLASNFFLKINNCIMINPIHIKEISDSKKRRLIMKCGTELNVSRRKWHLVKYCLDNPV
jgi:DNA-binding LytR/AlgR family response regulator